MAKVTPLPSIKNFETAINKHELNNLLKENDIPHPNSIFLKDISELDKLNAVKFPVLVKPLFDKGGDGIVKFDSVDVFKTFLENNHALFLQEYIEGYDIDCSVLCLEGKILCHTIQKGYLLGHSVYAPHLGFDFLNNDEVYTIVKQIMSEFNWSGVAHVDLRYDQNARNFKILEINGRFWGSVESSKIAGINFPDLAIKLALGKIIEPHKFQYIKVLRFKGFLKLVKRQPLTLLRFNFIKEHTEVPFVLYDPMPIVYRFFELIRRRTK